MKIYPFGTWFVEDWGDESDYAMIVDCVDGEYISYYPDGRFLGEHDVDTFENSFNVYPSEVKICNNREEAVALWEFRASKSRAWAAEHVWPRK